VIACHVDGLAKPKAVVVVRPEARAELDRPGGAAALAAALQAHVKAALPPYKYPREVAFVDELPRNDRGKIDRGALARAQAAGGLPAAEAAGAAR
jgi:acyl-coenzyme A synthetase/AMP-(fatty) acid ligase